MNGIRVSNGKFQVVDITYQGRKSVVTPISGWLPVPATCQDGSLHTNDELVAGTKYEGMKFGR
jgi:hypothetical protein